MFLITVIYLIMTSILLHIKTFRLSHIKFDFVSKYSHPCDCLSNMKYWSHKWQLVIKYPFIEVFQIWRCLKKCQNSSPKYIFYNFFKLSHYPGENLNRSGEKINYVQYIYSSAILCCNFEVLLLPIYFHLMLLATINPQYVIALRAQGQAFPRQAHLSLRLILAFTWVKDLSSSISTSIPIL